jgi:hypothetical protein
MGLPTTRSTTRECERIGATQFVFSNKTFFNDLYQEGGEEKKRREGTRDPMVMQLNARYTTALSRL